MALNDAVLLAVFAFTVLSASLQALSASGHFPRPHRAGANGGVSRMVLLGSIALTLASLLAGAIAAFVLLPWYAVIIGGGMAILIAPIILQQFPDSFVDGLTPLILFALVAAALALVLTLAAWQAPVHA